MDSTTIQWLEEQISLLTVQLEQAKELRNYAATALSNARADFAVAKKYVTNIEGHLIDLKKELKFIKP